MAPETRVTGIKEIAREHSNNDKQAILLLMSHAVEMAQGLPAECVGLDEFVLMRTYTEQLLAGAFKALEGKR